MARRLAAPSELRSRRVRRDSARHQPQLVRERRTLTPARLLAVIAA